MVVLVLEHLLPSGLPLIYQVLAWAFQGDTIVYLLEKLPQSRNQLWVWGLQIWLCWHCCCLIFCCLPCPMSPGIIIWLKVLGAAVRLVPGRLGWFSWLTPSGC